MMCVQAKYDGNLRFAVYGTASAQEVGSSRGSCWVKPPPTNCGILGIYKDLNMTTITSSGHY